MEQEIVALIEKVTTLCYCQQENMAMEKMQLLVEKLVIYMQEIGKSESNKEKQIVLQNILEALLESMENKDYILLADILEFNLKSFFSL